jgi:hypothetical protein
MKMANTYTWSVDSMTCKPKEGDKTDVVITVFWRLIGTDGAYSGSAYGSANLEFMPDRPFTPYSDLTEDQVVAWVQEALGPVRMASYEANVAAQIQDQITPPVVTLPLPWGSPNTAA